jgi:hypothetical protein
LCCPDGQKRFNEEEIIMRLTDTQKLEQSAWIASFERRWGCKLTARRTDKVLEIAGLDEEKVGACPVCDIPIHTQESSVVGCINGVKALVHERCCSSFDCN